MNKRTRFISQLPEIFGGPLRPSQLDGVNLILDRAGTSYDYRHLAYIFATVYHEVAKTMQPIREWGLGKRYPYGKPDPETGETYYGRGFVQLTHKRNYQLASRKLGVDFVKHPDLVMLPGHAVDILFEGMEQGWFTGKKLSDYINDQQVDYKNARRIINGTDRAELIAGYAVKFEKALNS